MMVFFCMPGCRAAAPVTKDHDRLPSDQPAKTPKPPAAAATPGSDDALIIEDHTDRWVYALQYKNGLASGQVRGSFDQQRNKIIIDTHDVERFRIDMTRLPINWSRLVIIRLNGKSSELRRRESDVIDFEIDDHGNWVVFEP